MQGGLLLESPKGKGLRQNAASWALRDPLYRAARELQAFSIPEPGIFGVRTRSGGLAPLSANLGPPGRRAARLRSGLLGSTYGEKSLLRFGDLRQLPPLELPGLV